MKIRVGDFSVRDEEIGSVRHFFLNDMANISSRAAKSY